MGTGSCIQAVACSRGYRPSPAGLTLATLGRCVAHPLALRSTTQPRLPLSTAMLLPPAPAHYPRAPHTTSVAPPPPLCATAFAMGTPCSPCATISRPAPARPLQPPLDHHGNPYCKTRDLR